MSSTFLSPFSVEAPELRLVVLHHAGGSAASYYMLGKMMPENWEVLLLDLPGRGRQSDHPPLVEMHEIVKFVVGEIDKISSSCPLAFFGHSMGAIIASEVTYQLTVSDSPPVWLGVSGRHPPGVVKADSNLELHLLDDSALLRELSLLGGMPKGLSESRTLLGHFLPLLRSDLAAVSTYNASSLMLSPQTPISAFCGSTDPWVTPSMMSGWATHTMNFEPVHIFPGGHFYHQGEEGARRLAIQIREDIGKLIGGSE